MENLRKGILVKNNVAVGAIGDKYFSTCPLGTVLSYAGNTIPHGYLLADGASYKVADYPDLYAVIGNTYGGDTENFNVPNLVDKFIQGSTTSGEEKEAGLPNITGSFLPWAYQNALSPSGAFSQSYTNVSAYDAYGANKGSQINFNASQSNSIYGKSTTVQPPALTMVYIIKAFHTNEGVDSKNEVSDPIIEYVDGEIAKVEATMDKVGKKSISHQSVAPNETFTLDNDCVALLVDWWNSDVKDASLVSIIPKRDTQKWYLGTSGAEYVTISGNTFTNHCSSGIYLHVVEIF